MQTEQGYSQRAPAEWSGARAQIQKWLAKKCAVESVAHLAGGSFLLIFGVVALVFTSCVTAGLASFILFEASMILEFLGFDLHLLRPVLFGILFVLFLGLSIFHAYRTRWGDDSVAKTDLSMDFSNLLTMGLEFISAGPILLILAIQDLQRYRRMTQMDLPHVSALLLWLHERGGRAVFAEIALAFPGLNAVRVLPQLRDLPGIHWWPDGGEIWLSDELKATFEELLGRKAKVPPFERTAYERREQTPPVAEVNEDIRSWYAALNLPLFAGLPEVKARYRKLAKIYHPDTRAANPGASAPTDEEMKRINAAYHNILARTKGQAGAER